MICTYYLYWSTSLYPNSPNQRSVGTYSLSPVNFASEYLQLVSIFRVNQSGLNSCSVGILSIWLELSNYEGLLNPDKYWNCTGSNNKLYNDIQRNLCHASNAASHVHEVATFTVVFSANKGKSSWKPVFRRSLLDTTTQIVKTTQQWKDAPCDIRYSSPDINRIQNRSPFVN